MALPNPSRTHQFANSRPQRETYVPAGQTPQHTHPSALQPGTYYPNGYGRSIPPQVAHHPRRLPSDSPDQQSYSPYTSMGTVYNYQANLPNATPSHQSSRHMQTVPPSSFVVPRMSYRKRINRSREDSDGESSDEDEGTGTSSSHTSGNMASVSTHSRRKLYVSALENYVTGSTEALRQTGVAPPPMRRALTSKGLTAATHSDMVNVMTNKLSLLKVAVDSKEEERSAKRKRQNPSPRAGP